MRGELSVEVVGRGRIVCPPGMSVLRAMVATGRRDLPVGCRSGGCGVCRVRVDHGEYTVGPMSAAQVDTEDAARGIALACRLFPSTDLRVTAIGRRPPPDPHVPDPDVPDPDVPDPDVPDPDVPDPDVPDPDVPDPDVTAPNSNPGTNSWRS